MRTSFNLLLLLAYCVSYGQQADSFTFLGNGFDRNWNPSSFQLNTEASLNSNAVNTIQFSDVLFRSSFTSEGKQSFLDGTQPKVNVYSFAAVGGEYKLNKRWGLYAKAQTMNGYSASKRFSEFLLLGNATFVNEKVETKDFRFIRYSGYGAGATYNLNSGKKVRAKLYAGVLALSNYRAVGSSNISLFTAAQGEYIDVATVGFAITEHPTMQIAGIGLDLGLDLSYTANSKNTFQLKAKDLNVTRLFNTTTIELDTAFRFSGIGYDVVNDTNTLQQYIDTNYLPIVENAKKELNWTTLPSRINFSWHRKLSCRTTLITTVQSIDLGKYGITGVIGVNHEFSNRFKLHSSLGYGNFTGIIWRESAEYRFKKYNVFASIQGLHSLVVPRIATNYGATLGFAKSF